VTAGITPIVMPKWGLEMREGTILDWLVDEGAHIEVGTPIIDVETDKISNAVEAPDPGLLRRRIAKAGDTLPVKALLGVLAEAEVGDADIDAFIAAFVVPESGDAEEEGAAFDFVEVDGIRVRYARRGPAEGVPLLFIHGYGGDLGNWLFNLDALAERHPVIALDLPAHGQSEVRLPGHSIAALAQFVVSFMQAIGADRAHLVGHSMGGAIAARMALDAPERVASVALIASAGLGDEINAGYIEGFAKSPSRRELKPVLEQLFADPTLVTRQMIDDVLKYKRLDGVEPLLAQLGDALFGGGRQAALPGRELASAGKPVLVVWGRDDRIIPAAHAANAPPGATVRVFDGAGHMAMMEKANDVNALLRAHVGASLGS
jgi:pyruvate dehydrogenase E2 component (dihydrolipoamide acetyltransferase)